MNPTILLLSIPFFAVITFALAFLSQKLYLKVYEPHISMEPVSQFKVPFSKQVIFFTIAALACMLAPLFLWAQNLAHSSEFIFLCGLAITFFASMGSRTITSLCIYKYIQNHPGLVTGKVIFKPPFIHIINAATSLQQLMLVGIISCFIPKSAFLIGALVSLIISVVTQYFSQYKKS